jgi:hypothetical protein
LPGRPCNLLNGVSGNPAESVTCLRACFRLNDQNKRFTRAAREENVSGDLVWSPASELAAIKASEAAAFYSHPQKAVLILCYTENRCGW